MHGEPETRRYRPLWNPQTDWDADPRNQEEEEEELEEQEAREAHEADVENLLEQDWQPTPATEEELALAAHGWNECAMHSWLEKATPLELEKLREQVDMLITKRADELRAAADDAERVVTRLGIIKFSAPLKARKKRSYTRGKYNKQPKPVVEETES